MLTSFWEEFLISIKETQKKNPIYYSLLKDVRLIELKEDALVLSCSGLGAKKYLERKQEDIENRLSLFANKKIGVSFVITTQIDKNTEPLLNFEPSKEDVFRKAGLRSNLNFDNFAVSSTNQVAF